MTNRTPDENGWFEIRDNPISRAGVFPYTGKSLGLADREDEMFYVYRPAAELADEDCIASIKLLPWIDDHSFMGPSARENFGDSKPAEEVGVEGIIGEQVYFRDGVLYANLKLFSEDMLAKIGAGKKELSLGFTCVYESSPGQYEGQEYQYVQRRLRGNHLALVAEGRMGPEVAVLDARLNFTCDGGDFKKMADEKTEVGDEEITEEVVAKILAECVPDILKLILAKRAGAAPVGEDEDGEDEDEGEKPPADAEDEPVAEPAANTETITSSEDSSELKKLRAEIRKLQSAQDSSELIMLKRHARRDHLVNRLRPLIGVFDHSEMTLDKVARYGASKLGLKVPSGQELVALDAYFTAAEKVGAERFTVRLGGDSATRKTSIFDSAFSEQ